MKKYIYTAVLAIAYYTVCGAITAILQKYFDLQPSTVWMLGSFSAVGYFAIFTDSKFKK
jgi:hypothetical protein